MKFLLHPVCLLDPVCLIDTAEYIISFDLVTVFAETKSVTKSRLHCTLSIADMVVRDYLETLEHFECALA